MKKLMFAFFPWLFMSFGYKAMAQDDMMKRKNDNEKREAEEIIIRKKGDKDVTINVQINGDKITINGKPISEYKDDDVTVNRRKTIVRNGDANVFGFGDHFENGGMAWSDDEGEKRAFLGVNTEKTGDGAKIVEEVSKESAAGKAGLQKGDIITKFDNKKIEGPQSLYEAVNSKKPKDEVQINYMRDGKEKNVKATLGERKTSFSKSYSFNAPDGSYKTFTMPFAPDADKWKMEGDLRQLEKLQELQGQIGGMNGFNYGFPRRQKLGLKIQDTEDEKGVKILEVQDSSAAAQAGLKKDDIIIEIGGEKVKNTDEARDLLSENNEKGSYPLKARRNGSEMTFTIKIPKKLKTTNL